MISKGRGEMKTATTDSGSFSHKVAQQLRHLLATNMHKRPGTLSYFHRVGVYAVERIEL